MSVVAPVSISVPKDGKAGRNDGSCKVKVVRSEERESSNWGCECCKYIYIYFLLFAEIKNISIIKST